MIKRILATFLLFVLSLSFCSCEVQNPKPKSDSFYSYFNTYCTVSDYSGLSDGDFSALSALVSDELQKYHRLFDIYNDYAGIVNLKTINDMAGQEVKVSRELFEFLVYAKEMHALTGGNMNVAMGSVLRLWHEKRELALENPSLAALPEASALAAASMHTDIEKVVLNEEKLTVTLLDPEMSLDVGAIGKGYAGKVIAEKLSAMGYGSLILDLGGNLTVIGTKPNGDKFKTGIRNPLSTSSDDRYIEIFEIADASLSTSGDYERYYSVNGQNYHHIIDKDTLMPSVGYRSVTVLAFDPALSDTLSTALFCMELDEGRALIDNLEGVEALWLLDNGEVVKSKSFP